MAQTGYTPLSLYYSSTAAAAPVAGNLVNGELAINITDGKLYYKDNAGVVQTIATKGSAVVGGSNTQVQFNSSGVLAGSANLTWDGSTLAVTGAITASADSSFNSTGAVKVPVGTTAQQPGTPATGMLRFNSTDVSFEGYDGSAWGAIGGGSNITPLGMWENAIVIAANYTITAGNNAVSAGPITINSGITVTVPSGSTWTVV
jgi:hypothetical protein